MDNDLLSSSLRWTLPFVIPFVCVHEFKGYTLISSQHSKFICIGSEHSPINRKVFQLSDT